MSELVYSETNSGLVLATEGADAAAVSALLREYDSDLRLVPGPGGLWKVYKWMGPDRDSVYLFSWQNEDGTPRPLSSGILERVKLADKEGRGYLPDADELNRLHREELERRQAEDAEALAADWRTREGKSALLPRGRSLYLARARARARGEQK